MSAKPALFPLIFIASPHRPIQVALSMRLKLAKLLLKIRGKIFDFFGQSELRKRSIIACLLIMENAFSENVSKKLILKLEVVSIEGVMETTGHPLTQHHG